jgi:C_GCAxxG_C_C family probable redox protein
MSKKEKAITYFLSHFNCCQSVISVFCEDYGLEESLALKLSTGFGGGLRRGEVCGAVSGAIMVIGLKYGHSVIEDLESKTRTYALSQEFESRFEDLFGSLRCKDILKYDVSDDEMKIIKEKELFTKLCPQIVKGAIDILEEMLSLQ